MGMTDHIFGTPGSITVRSVTEFSQHLIAAMEDHGDVALDLSALEEVDLSFVQLVLSARSHGAAEGRTLRLAQPAGEAVTALLRRAGFLTDPDPGDIDFWFHGDLPQ